MTTNIRIAGAKSVIVTEDVNNTVKGGKLTNGLSASGVLIIRSLSCSMTHLAFVASKSSETTWLCISRMPSGNWESKTAVKL